MDSKHAPEGDRGHASEDGRILSQLEEAAKKLGSVIGGCSAGRSAKP
jgi:hypothetical protein